MTCKTCNGSEVVTKMVAPGDWWDEECPDCIEFWRKRSDGWERYAKDLEERLCTCWVSEPDEFGNRDLLVAEDCPLHAESLHRPLDHA